MDKMPEHRDARLADLEGWAKGQARRLAAEERSRRNAEQIPRVLAQARQRIGQVDSLREAAVIPVVITKPSDRSVDRSAVFADLMVRLREYQWADPIVSVCDEPSYIAPNAIDLARSHRPDASWLLYMEDDVILGPDFGLLPGLLREADELFPYTGVVSFFSGSFGEPGWSIHPMEQFGWLQCAAIRNTDRLAGLRDCIDDIVTRNARWYGLPDGLIGTFLAVEYDAYALWCPSLVQHAEVTSAFSGERTGTRISLTYEQAYG